MTDGLKFGVYGMQRGTGADPAALAARARRAERAGFESLWVGDHIALPGDRGGRQPRLEVVVAISYLAAVTTGIRLGFGVPPPVQRPHPPIVVGGHSEAACRRAATTASGWYGVFLDVGDGSDLEELIDGAAATLIGRC